MTAPAAVEVVLGLPELTHAVRVGADRGLRQLLAGRPHSDGFAEDDWWAPPIEGAIGEQVVSVLTGLRWTGAYQGRAEDTDVAGLQVRTTTRHHGHLLIRPYELAKVAIWVAVSGEVNKDRAPYRVHGWISTAEVRGHEEWLHRNGTTRPPCYWVPYVALHPASELIVRVPR